MKIFVNKDIKHFFLAIMVVLVNFLVLTEVLIWVLYEKFSFWLLFLSLLTTFAILMVCFLYFRRQNKMLEDAVSQINSYLGGNANARIECDDEGELYRLFHSVNSLAAVLNAHAANEAREKQFLKNTISDISHQLKTPLAALNIYNGLLQDEAEKLPNIKEFATLSEQELDRIETLVQSLLKITKLDAGSIVIEKSMESVADMMQDVEQHFAYRARQEQKEILLSESEDISLLCDRDWLIEAIDNIVKNALDHTANGDTVRMRLTGECRFAMISVVLKKDVSEAAVSKIRDLVGDCLFVDNREENSDINGSYWVFRIASYGFLAIISLITVLNITNSISMGVSARIKQYGAMRAVGMGSGQVAKMITAEAVTYAICGTAAGIILGLLLHYLIYAKIVITHFGGSWNIPFATIAIVLLLVVFSCIVAIYAPAKRIRNMAITATINEL